MIVGDLLVQGDPLDDTEPVVLASVGYRFLVAYVALRSGGKNVVGRPVTLDPGFRRGDSNADGVVDIADVEHLASYFLKGGDGPPCHEAADADDSGYLSLSDIFHPFHFLFDGVRVMEYPGAFACGPDPTPDSFPVPCSYQACWPAPVSPHDAFTMRVEAPGTGFRVPASRCPSG